MQTAAIAIGGYAVMPPRPGLASYGPPSSQTIPSAVFGMRPGRYC